MTEYATLIETLNAYAERARHERLTLGEVSDSLGGSSFSFMCIILSLPFLSPISLGPLATVGGLTLAALGWQLLRGYPAPRLPGRVRKIVMSPQLWQGLLTTCLKIVGWCRKLSRPRYSEWVNGARGAQLLGWSIASAGLLMAVPLFGLPFNNALPAAAILVVCLAELEDDGLLALAGLFLVGVSAVYILGIVVALYILGDQVLEIFN